MKIKDGKFINFERKNIIFVIESEKIWQFKFYLLFEAWRKRKSY